MPGDLCGPEFELNGSGGDAEQYHGSKFAGKMLDKWVYEQGIRIDFYRLGTPTDNVTVESFNGRLRQECLNENWFMYLEDAQCKIEAWRILYNQRRPHSALG